MLSKIFSFLFPKEDPQPEPTVDDNIDIEFTFPVTIPYNTVNFGRMRDWLNRHATCGYKLTNDRPNRQYIVFLASPTEATRFREAWRDE